MVKSWSKYRLSAWLRVSADFNGVTDSMLPSRWYAANGTILHDTLTKPAAITAVETGAVKRDGQWQLYSEVVLIDSSGDADGENHPAWFTLFVGRSLGTANTLHSAGTVDVAMISVRYGVLFLLLNVLRFILCAEY